MTREEIHKKVDSVLDEYGYEDNIPIKWGSITIQVDIQKGQEVVEITERKTKK